MKLASLILAFGVGASGCSDPGCGGNGDLEIGKNSPEITHLSFDHALEDDPWELIFALEFKDADGDLGRGRGEVYLNDDSEATNLKLYDAFRQAALSFDATKGRLALPLRFSDTVHDGQNVDVQMQLVDTSERRSNCYSVELEFKVRRLAARSWNMPRLAWAHLRSYFDGG